MKSVNVDTKFYQNIENIFKKKDFAGDHKSKLIFPLLLANSINAYRHTDRRQPINP